MSNTERAPTQRRAVTPTLWNPLVVISVAVVAALVAATVLYGLLAHFVFKLPLVRITDAGQRMVAVEILKAALGLAAGVGAVVALVVAYRRHRIEEAESLRDDERLFTERFQKAAEQLGHERAAVRLAGVYAMARLADDNDHQQQTCINVLCAYLRMPYNPASKSPHPHGEPYRTGERQVRLAIIDTITARLRTGTTHTWQGRDFDFTGATFDGGNFRGAHFSGGQVDFVEATFSAGQVTFTEATFSAGQVSFHRAAFSGGRVDFGNTRFSGGQVSFRQAVFSGGEVDFSEATFSGGQVSFVGSRLSAGHVQLDHAVFSGGDVLFGAMLHSGGRLGFLWAAFSGGQVSFYGTDFSGGEVDFVAATFASGQVEFSSATFSGGQVSFRGAKFLGGKVDFNSAELTGGQVSFHRAEFSGGTVSLGLVEFPGQRLNLNGPPESMGRMKFDPEVLISPPAGLTLPPGHMP